MCSSSGILSNNVYSMQCAVGIECKPGSSPAYNHIAVNKRYIKVAFYNDLQCMYRIFDRINVWFALRRFS